MKVVSLRPGGNSLTTLRDRGQHPENSIICGSHIFNLSSHERVTRSGPFLDRNTTSFKKVRLGKTGGRPQDEMRSLHTAAATGQPRLTSRSTAARQASASIPGRMTGGMIGQRLKRGANTSLGGNCFFNHAEET